MQEQAAGAHRSIGLFFSPPPSLHCSLLAFSFYHLFLLRVYHVLIVGVVLLLLGMLRLPVGALCSVSLCQYSYCECINPAKPVAGLLLPQQAK